MFNGDRVSGWGDGKFWRRTVGMGVQQRECASCHRALCLEMAKMENFCCAYSRQWKKWPKTKPKPRGVCAEPASRGELAEAAGAGLPANGRGDFLE